MVKNMSESDDMGKCSDIQVEQHYNSFKIIRWNYPTFTTNWNKLNLCIHNAHGCLMWVKYKFQEGQPPLS